MNAKLLPLTLLSFLVGCKSFPHVYYCVSDPDQGVMHCAPTHNGMDPSYDMPIEKSGNYVCTSPKDTQTIAEWMKRKCK